MRILSNFKDYYDGLQTPGETEPLYVRRTEQIENLPKEAFEGMKCRPERRYYKWQGPFEIRNGFVTIDKKTYDAHYVGFCGKLYLALTRQYSPVPIAYASSPESYLTAERLLDNMSEKELKLVRSSLIMKNHTIEDELYTIFSQFPKPLTEWQMENLPPVFVARETGRATPWYFHTNPKLETLGFASVMPPYEAFQELDMFLSNRANPEKAVKPVDDQSLLTQKGFDLKTSFRHPVK